MIVTEFIMSKCVIRRLFTGIAIGLIPIWISPSPLLAQQVNTNPALAETLFNEALALGKSGKYQEACPKFEASDRLDPTIPSKYYLADCYEQIGKYASAWALFIDVASQAARANQPERQKTAEERANKVSPKVPKLTIRVDPALAKLKDLDLRRDGETLPNVIWGVPVPVDPGEHSVEAQAPGRKTWQTTVTLAESENKTVEIKIVMDQQGTTTTTNTNTDTGNNTKPPSGGENAPATADRPANNTLLILGGTAAALGVGGIIAGSIFGLKAQAARDEAVNICGIDDLSACPTSVKNEAQAAADKGRTPATISTIGLGAGIPLAIGGVVLFIMGRGTSSKAPATAFTPVVHPKLLGASITHSF